MIFTRLKVLWGIPTPLLELAVGLFWPIFTNPGPTQGEDTSCPALNIRSTNSPFYSDILLPTDVPLPLVASYDRQEYTDDLFFPGPNTGFVACHTTQIPLPLVAFYDR